MKLFAIASALVLATAAFAESPCRDVDDPLSCVVDRKPREYCRTNPQDFWAVFNRQAAYLTDCAKHEDEVFRFYEFSPLMLGHAEFREGISQHTGTLALADAQCLARISKRLSPEAIRFLRMDLEAPVFHDAAAVRAAVAEAVGEDSTHPLAGL